MTTAAQMRERSLAGQANRASEYAAEQGQKAEDKARLEASIRDSIGEYCEKTWLPKLGQEADAGRTRVSMSLGYANSPEVQFRARYGKEHLEALGYKVETKTEFRKHSDDDPGDDEIDLIISW